MIGRKDGNKKRQQRSPRHPSGETPPRRPRRRAALAERRRRLVPHQSATLEQAADFIRHRAQQGFNALIVNAPEPHYGDRGSLTTEDGISPWVDAPFGEPNEAYFARLDYLLDVAAEHGVFLILAVCYMSYLDVGDGWLQSLQSTPPETAATWGRWIAARYQDRPNIIWMIGGDHDPNDGVREQFEAIVQAIRAVIPHAILTAHLHPEMVVRDVLGDPDWLNLDNVYSYGILHDKLERAWKREPTLLFIMIESSYENEREALALELRRQPWISFLNGATGACMGNLPIWRMGDGWLEQWDSPLALTQGALARFLRDQNWSTYVPDQEHAFLVDGWGGCFNMERAGFAVGVDGALGYFPTPRRLSLQLDRHMQGAWLHPVTLEPVAELGTREAGAHTLD